jgi:WD40 repeat protein
MKEGDCVAWDLEEREVSTLNTSAEADTARGIPLYYPSYNTLYDSITNNNIAVVSVKCAFNRESGSEQLYTASENGTLTIWSVVRENRLSFFDVDLGLRPGAKVFLNRLSVVKCSNVAPSVICMDISSEQYDVILLGMADGSIQKVERNNTNAKISRQYSSNKGETTEVLCLRISPFDGRVFAVGTSSGQVLVYCYNQKEPALALRSDRSSPAVVSHIEWSPSVSHFVYAIFNNDFLTVWDLSAEITPVRSYDLHDEMRSTIRCLATWRYGGIDFMAVGLANGQLLAHSLEEHSGRSNEDGLLRIVEKLARK